MTDDIEYVANSSRAWGKGDYETEALQRLTEHWHGDIPDTVEVSMARVSGFEGMGGTATQSWVNAETVHRVRQYEIPRADFKRLKDYLGEIDLAAEDCLVDNCVHEEHPADEE